MQNVKVDRNKFIGGSDIPIIMGISPFKSRFDLLLEKAGLKEDTFEGNQYTEYGNLMEEKIRDYINETYSMHFVEGKHIDGDIRCHTDGEDEDNILEIKTTSQIHESLEEYQVYLVQILFYMMNTNKNFGKLAIYFRPSDFNNDFDKDRLIIYDIDINNFKELCDKINKEVDRFREDLEKVKENPFITEEELLPVDLSKITNKILALEERLLEYKEIENQVKKLKDMLKNQMEKNDIKTWETPNGTKITLVNDILDKEVEVEYYDEDRFIAENTELHQNYHNKLAEYKKIKKEIKKGRSGYVKITTPKSE